MNKITATHQSERGQAIVLIILSIVGLFGFAALALDMGQVYMARRNAQTAADTAAMAAADDAVIGSKNQATAIGKAFVMASNNGFNNDGVTNTVVVNNPPVGGPYCGVCGSPTAQEYFQVKITVFVKPIFAQLFFNGGEETTVEAIAHAKKADSFTGNEALLSLSQDSDSMNFSGTVAVQVDGGNIRSVGGMVKNGNCSTGKDTNGKQCGITITGGGKTYYGTTFSGFGSVFKPEAPRKQTISALPNFNPPYCPTAAEAATWATAGIAKYKKINETNYYYYGSELSSNAKNVVTLPKGIHCINGGIGKGNFAGEDVLIVLLSGGIQQTGNDSLNFSTAPDLKDANGNQFGGMVIFAPVTNTSVLKFGGNSDDQLNGTFYAPGADCDLGGNSNGQAYHAAFVCNTMKFHGTPDFKISYNPAELFHVPPSVELAQ